MLSHAFRFFWLFCLISSQNAAVAKRVSAEEVLFVPSLSEILVEGNEDTKSLEVIRLSGLEIGQEVTPQNLEKARSALLSAALFETAEVTPISPFLGLRSVRVVIRVKEKLSWIVVPNLQYGSGSFGGGAAYLDSNWLGLAKKVLIAGNWSKTNRTAILGYRDPGVLGSKMILGFDGIYRWDTMKEYTDRKEIRKVHLVETGFTIMPGIQWNPRFSTSFGASYRRVKQRLRSETSPPRTLDADSLKSGNDISANVEFQYKGTENIDGYLRGSQVTLESQISDNRFYSDFNYFRQALRLLHARIFWENRLNYVANASAQFGSTLPYYRELMVGGTNLRGYLDRQFRGDTRYSMTHDLLFPLYDFKRVIFRGVVFWDTTVIYFKDGKFQRDNWRNGLGGGLRLYFKGITIPLVGYDIGWAVEEDAYEHYLNVGVQF